VIYPRYELAPGGHGTVAHIVRAADLAMRRLGEPRVPIIGIGYSRGARLVMDWAAVESGRRYVPRALVSVFPASGEDPEEDLSRIPLATRIVILVGDSDEVVGVLGAQALLQQLDVPQPMFRNLGAETVRSTPTFKASHLSVLETSAGARKAFWGRADRLVAYARAH